MDTYNSKRKKRKTRKCLDELRKRSLLFSNYGAKNVKNDVDFRISDSLNVVNKKLSNITTNRLTLSMFHKAVRSETITRPILSEISHAPFLNINNELIGKKAFQNITEKKAIVINTDSSHHSVMNHINLNRYDVIKQTHRNFCDINNQSGISPNSFILFSPLAQPVEMEVFEDSENQEQTPQSNINSPMLQSIQESCKVYENIINEIPKFVRENLSVLLQEDVMAKTRILLNNIYMGQQCHDIKLQDIKQIDFGNSDVSDMSMTTVVQNPVDYIRLGQVWEKITHPVRHQNNSSSSDTALSLMRPCFPQDPQSPLIPHSAAQSSPVMYYSPPLSTSDSLPFSDINGSPEYTYYPHKLNE